MWLSIIHPSFFELKKQQKSNPLSLISNPNRVRPDNKTRLIQKTLISSQRAFHTQFVCWNKTEPYYCNGLVFFPDETGSEKPTAATKYMNVSSVLTWLPFFWLSSASCSFFWSLLPLTAPWITPELNHCPDPEERNNSMYSIIKNTLDMSLHESF